MPQIQIIGREAIDDQNNRTTQALKQQELIQNSQAKMIQFKQMGEQLRLMAKNTDNDIEKIKVDRLGHRMNYMSNVFKMAMDNPNPENVIKTALQLGGGDIVKDLSDPLVADMISKLKPSGQAEQSSAVGALVRSKIGGGQPSIEGTQGLNPNQPAMNALGGNTNGGLDISAINAGGVQIEDYGAQARGAAMKTKATAQAQKDIDMEPIRSSVGNYLSVFDNAVQEMGGLETNALSALAKGKGAEISSQIGNMPNVFTLSKLIEPVSLQLGSYLNKGRPTDKDQEAAKSTLTRITYTQGANSILRNYLQTIASNGDKELATKLFWSLAKAGGSTSQDARAYGNTDMLSTKPATSRFTIRIKK
jgi:hypothetical protein